MTEFVEIISASGWLHVVGFKGAWLEGGVLANFPAIWACPPTGEEYRNRVTLNPFLYPARATHTSSSHSAGLLFSPAHLPQLSTSSGYAN